MPLRCSHRLFRAALPFGLLLGLASSALLPATEPPPDPPLIGAAPDPCAWVVTVQQKKAVQPPADPKAAALFQRMAQALPRTVRVEVDKSGGNRREVTFWEDKRTSSLFVYAGWVVYQLLSWPPDQVMAVPIGNHLSPIKGGRVTDFTDLDWVRAEVYVGKRSYAGRDCFYYEDKKHAALSGGSALAAPVPGVHAWIDVASRLPVAVEDDAVLKTYAFRQTGVNVELPAPFAHAYETALANVKATRARNPGNPPTP